MKGATKMANRKSGSIAVPFLATIFIGLIVIGGIAAGLYKYLGFGKQEKPSEPIPRTSGMVRNRISVLIYIGWRTRP